MSPREKIVLPTQDSSATDVQRSEALLQSGTPVSTLFLPIIWIAVRRGLRGAIPGLLALKIGLALVMYGWPQQLDQLADLQFLMFILAVTGLILGGSSDERPEAKRRAEEKLESLRLILARESAALMQRACAPSSIQLRSACSNFLVRATCLEDTFILSATTPARAGRASADRARLFLPVRSPSSQTEFRGHCGQCVAKYTT